MFEQITIKNVNRLDIRSTSSLGHMDRDTDILVSGPVSVPPPSCPFPLAACGRLSLAVHYMIEIIPQRGSRSKPDSRLQETLFVTLICEAVDPNHQFVRYV